MQNDFTTTAPKAFEEYGIYASEMAKAYDKIDKKNSNKDFYQVRGSYEKMKGGLRGSSPNQRSFQ